MNDRNLKIWAEQCIARGEAGDRSVRGQPLMVAMGILRLLGEKQERETKAESRLIGVSDDAR